MKDEVEVVVFLEVFEAIARREFGVETDETVDAAEREGVAYQPESDAPQADVEKVLQQDARRVLLTDRPALEQRVPTLHKEDHARTRQLPHRVCRLSLTVNLL